MIINIVQHAPVWVWVLLAFLVRLGVLQSLPRRVSLRRASLLPVLLVGLSISGIASAFPGQAGALAAWAVAAVAVVALSLWLGFWRGISWSAAEQRLAVPGSWTPLVLILSLFVIKFGVGASLAMHPALAHDAGFAEAVGLAYGVFSGAFLGRSVAMWQVAHRGLQAPVAL